MMKPVQLLHTLSSNTWKGGMASLFSLFIFPCLPCLVLCSIKCRALIPIKSVWTRKSYENKYREGRQSSSGLSCSCYKLPSVVAGPSNSKLYFWKTSRPCVECIIMLHISSKWKHYHEWLLWITLLLRSLWLIDIKKEIVPFSVIFWEFWFMTEHCCLNEFWKFKESELTAKTDLVPEWMFWIRE